MLHRPNRPGWNGRPGKGSNAVAVWSPQLVFISRYLVRVRFPAPSILAWSERQYVSESPIYPFGPVSIELFRSTTNCRFIHLRAVFAYAVTTNKSRSNNI